MKWYGGRARNNEEFGVLNYWSGSRLISYPIRTLGDPNFVITSRNWTALPAPDSGPTAVSTAVLHSRAEPPTDVCGQPGSKESG